ncbi:MAG: hypothetical protein AUH81_12445 [Candidatus Rokubacteria bacterium 13_1_40CM_4_69_5]|nr:MAG: hypothetical protein AUH81_12445 [Candidatus Rokubacteria bacterium 13_1_40CM_4_69_5]
MKTLVVAAAGLSLLGPALGAQQRVRVTAWGDGAIVRLGTQILGARESQSGPIFGGEAGLGLGPVTLGAGYLEGRLQPGSSGTPKGRDLVEARIFVSARPVPWLTLSAGPRVRAFVTDSATERWVLWQVRARAQNALASTPLQTYIELWRALSARVNLPEPVDHVQGGEAGVVLRPRGSAVWLRLGYRVDGAQLGGGSRSESVEAVSFAVGIGPR